MATESKQIDGVVDDPENGGLKSGPCLIAGFHALSCTSPSYHNPYRGVNKNTLANRLRSTARHRVSPVYLGVYHPVYQAAPRQANR